MDRHLLVDEAALGVLLGRLDRLLGDFASCDDDSVFGGKHLKHFRLLALVISGDNLDRIALFDLEFLGHYKTSGASETIFMKFA